MRRLARQTKLLFKANSVPDLCGGVPCSPKLVEAQFLMEQKLNQVYFSKMFERLSS